MLNKIKTIAQNAAFYDHATPHNMQKLAGMCGLLGNGDIRQIEQEIREAHTILELGAGYGRVLESILEINPDVNLWGLEASASKCHALRKKYSYHITLLEQNWDELNAAAFEQRFDLLTWMWGSIIDTIPSQRVALFKKLHGVLNPGGKLAIDVSRDRGDNLADRLHKIFSYIEDVVQKPYFFQIPSARSIRYYAKTSGFSAVERRPYMTDTGAHRVVYCLTK